MDTATILWALLFGSIGLGYFIYGRRQSHAVARYTGIALMVCPYFVSNTVILVIVGISLLLLPKCLRL
ncbi:hypothetical protein EYC98_11045 [Halieaceae bacterium IMCC14734]|uniref:Amino acid transporter n=1 Tax=Candidatus Litorirhabdus singularis TaxID=2518993 RepID=A0ABT3TGG0_9GAMM|nr:hypothetical protein [Candidatus Litorirhabdus singularis]